MTDRAATEAGEAQVYQSLVRGMLDYAQGKTFSKEELKRRIAEKSFGQDEGACESGAPDGEHQEG